MTQPDLLDAITAQTATLEETVRGLDDPSAPSLCAGWSRGHVITHLARNGDAMAALVRSAVDGTGETMYSSSEQRDADIDAGADRPLGELVADLETADALALQALPRLGPEHADTVLERVPGVAIAPARLLPFMRLRELVYHHVDLDAGFTFADVDPDLLLTFLDDEMGRLRRVGAPAHLVIRSEEGEEWSVGDGEAHQVTGSRAALLGWLARGQTAGVTGAVDLPGGR